MPVVSGGPYPARDGNCVRPWIDGVPFYTRLAAAFRAARRRIWAIVSFIEPGFCFPDGTDWWDLLDECAARGVDVRVLFWRNPGFRTDHVFRGGPEERGFLRRRGARFAARWDSSGADPAHCHHQKGYVVDAGEDDAIAFIGGMVLSRSTLASPGHRHGQHKHDAFLELRGPVVVDAEHNFVQRWNLGRRDDAAPPWPDEARAGLLAWPRRIPAACGEVRVQLARTIRPGAYVGSTPVAGVGEFDGAAGEATIHEQYLAAFAAARRSIYLENQHPGELSLLTALAAALGRGVQVVMVVPGQPMPAIVAASRECAAWADRERPHRYASTFAGLAALADSADFTLAALARSDPGGAPGVWSHREIYTHAKLCVVDGAWATLGSANLVDLSMLPDHTELNAAWWSRELCTALVCELAYEHCEVREVDDVAALTSFARVARASRDSVLAGGPVLAGCYALDARSYAQGLALTQRPAGAGRG